MLEQALLGLASSLDLSSDLLISFFVHSFLFFSAHLQFICFLLKNLQTVCVSAHLLAKHANLRSPRLDKITGLALLHVQMLFHSGTDLLSQFESHLLSVLIDLSKDLLRGVRLTIEERGSLQRLSLVKFCIIL